MGRDKPMLKALVEELGGRRRGRREINLSRLEKLCKPKDSVVVPGIVLGSGEVTKPISVFALRFSAAAEEKIKKAGGSCFGLGELLEKQPKGLRIIG